MERGEQVGSKGVIKKNTGPKVGRLGLLQSKSNQKIKSHLGGQNPQGWREEGGPRGGGC